MMPVRLLRPYAGQNVGTIYSGTDESILRATGTADDYVELATNYVPTGSSSFRAYASSFSTSSPAGSIVAALTDPFRGQGRGVTTYATTGTVPGQLSLGTSNTIIVGGTAAVVGTIYPLSIIATAGDGSQSVTGTFNFKAITFSYNAGTPGFSAGSGPVQSISALPNLTTAIAAIHAMALVVPTYTGPLFQLIRASDNATLDVLPLSTGIPNYGAIDSWMSGTTAKIAIVYDQTGNGRHATQTTAAMRPNFSAVATENNIRGMVFDYWPDRAQLKFLSVPAIAGLANQNFGVHQVNSYRSMEQVDTFISFQNAGATADVLVLRTNSLGIETFDGASSRQGSAIYAPSGIGTLAYGGAAGNEFLYVNGKKNTLTARTAVSIANGAKLGGAASGGQDHLTFSNIIFLATPADADIAALEAWSNANFGKQLAAPAYNIVYSGSSLITAWGGTMTQNPANFMAPLLPTARIYNAAVGGRSLSGEYGGRNAGYKVAGIPNTLIIDQPGNDMGPLTFTSQADAWAYVDAFTAAPGTTGTYSGGTVQPWFQSMVVWGKANIGPVIVPTIIGTVDNSKFVMDAFNRYNANIKALAASVGFTITDRAGDPRLMDNNNPLYFNPTTNVHPTDLGTSILAAIDVATIKTVFGIS